MNQLLTRLLGCVACLSLVSVADAQMVRIGGFGGVRIRAPFVSVDVLPFGGGTRVRAPFTAVDTRLYSSAYRGYYPPAYAPRASYYGAVPATRAYPRYPNVVYPTPDPVPPAGAVAPRRPASSARVGSSAPTASVPDLPNRLAAAAAQLQRSLAARRDDGDIWLDYLAPDRIVAAAQRNEPGSTLSRLLMNYEGVIGNSDLTSIWETRGFRETYRLLDLYVRGNASASGSPRETSSRQSESVVVPPDPRPSAGSPTLASPVRPATEAEQPQSGAEQPQSGAAEPQSGAAEPQSGAAEPQSGTGLGEGLETEPAAEDGGAEDGGVPGAEEIPIPTPL